jgi:tetratricopeptide (TPR) repeat protein
MIRAIAIVAFLIGSSTAYGQAAAAQAEALFRQGRELMAAGNVAEACSAFEESQKLDPAVTTLLNLGGCREKLGQIATAWGLFLDAARQTRAATDAAGQKLHGVAQARVDKLEPRVSKLTIHVAAPAKLDGLQITRGAEPIAAGLWNRALPIDGGTYTIAARAPGQPAWSTEVKVAAEADSQTVEVPDLRTLPRPVDKPVAPPVVAGGRDRPPAPPPRVATVVRPPVGERPAPPARPVPVVAPPAAKPPRAVSAEPAPASSGSGKLVLAIGAVALGGAALGLELWGESTYNDAKAEMTSQARRDDLYHSATTKRYAAEGLAVGAGVAGIAAAWLYLRGGDERGATARVQVVPAGAGLAVVGGF